MKPFVGGQDEEDRERRRVLSSRAHVRAQRSPGPGIRGDGNGE